MNEARSRQSRARQAAPGYADPASSGAVRAVLADELRHDELEAEVGREARALAVRRALARESIDDLLERVAGLRAIRLRQLAAARSGPLGPADRRAHARSRRAN